MFLSENQLLDSIPAGRHGIDRGSVEAHQRERILDALVSVICDRGPVDFTVRDVVRAASVSSKTFYELFASRRELVVAAFEASFARLLERIERACALAADRPARVAAAVGAAVDLAIEEPGLARLLTVEGFAVAGTGPSCAQQSRRRLAVLLASGCDGSSGAELPPVRELAIVAAIWTVVADCLHRGDPARLSELEGELIEFALAPYRPISPSLASKT